MRTSAPLPGFSASGCVFQQPDSERAWGKKTLSSQELRPHVLGFVSDNFTPKDWSLTSCVKIATSQSPAKALTRLSTSERMSTSKPFHIRKSPHPPCITPTWLPLSRGLKVLWNGMVSEHNVDSAKRTEEAEAAEGLRKPQPSTRRWSARAQKVGRLQK